MPSTAFDTFFACTIIVAAVLIATAFLGVTLQARIAGTDDTNKDNYLKAIADHIITYSGNSHSWGTGTAVPTDFGLAQYPSTCTYQLDIDKVSRLNRNNKNMLSYIDIVNSAKLNNMSLAISVKQVMDLSVEQLNAYAIDEVSYAELSLATSINSRPISARLNCYVVADNYLYNVSAAISLSGSYTLTVHVPTNKIESAFVVAFARSEFDDRITSYAVYNLPDATQESSPASTSLSLSPQNHRLSFAESSGVIIEKVYALTYSHYTNITDILVSDCAIPRLVSNSPIVLVTCGQTNTLYFEEWTSYPQVPLEAGSTFTNSERNVYSYLVTVEDVLYRAEISLGDIYR